MMDTPLIRIQKACALLNANNTTILAADGWKSAGNLHDPLIVCVHAARDKDTVVLGFANGTIARIFHQEDCCETVWLEDVSGDLNDLIGHPLGVCERRTQDSPDAAESATWTFVTLRANGGSVDLRWYGESNGYYSEEATIQFWAPDIPFSCSSHDILAAATAAKQQ